MSQIFIGEADEVEGELLAAGGVLEVSFDLLGKAVVATLVHSAGTVSPLFALKRFLLHVLQITDPCEAISFLYEEFKHFWIISSILSLTSEVVFLFFTDRQTEHTAILIQLEWQIFAEFSQLV